MKPYWTILLLVVVCGITGCTTSQTRVKKQVLEIQRPDRTLFGMMEQTYLCRKLGKKKVLCRAKSKK